MTLKEFASGLDGRKYGKEITLLEIQQAKELGFVVVFGASDDLCEFRGAIDDEADCYAWTYKTEIPHECFDIYEDGEKYCRGIVFEMSAI